MSNEEINRSNENSNETIFDAYATSIIASIGLIGLVLSFCIGDRKNDFSKRHLNQAIILSICDLALFSCTISGFLFLPEFVLPAAHIAQVILFVMRVIGIITAVQKKNSELPLIGKIKVIK